MAFVSMHGVDCTWVARGAGHKHGLLPSKLHPTLSHARTAGPHFTPRFILTAARLVAPLLDPSDLAAGYDWCRGQLAGAGA